MRTLCLVTCIVIASACGSNASSSESTSSASPAIPQSSGASASESSASRAPETPMTPAAVAGGISRVSDTERTITAESARALGGHTSEMLGATHFEPHNASGRVDGVQVFGVRPDDVATALGVLNGDVLTAVGEVTADTAEHALQGLAQIASRAELHIRLIRRGQPVEIIVRSAAAETFNSAR